MAKLTREDVLKLAQLSRLKLSDEEVLRFQDEITEILQYVEKLQSVDLAGVDPTYQVSGLSNVMREDAVYDYGVKAEDLLKNATVAEDGHIQVKRIIE